MIRRLLNISQSVETPGESAGVTSGRLLKQLTHFIQTVLSEFHVGLYESCSHLIPCRHCLAMLRSSKQSTIRDDYTALTQLANAKELPSYFIFPHPKGSTSQCSESKVYLFPYRQCLLSSFSEERMDIFCPVGGVSVQLPYLAPDLTIASVPFLRGLVIFNKLGEGGFASVYRGMIPLPKEGNGDSLDCDDTPRDVVSDGMPLDIFFDPTESDSSSLSPTMHGNAPESSSSDDDEEAPCDDSTLHRTPPLSPPRFDSPSNNSLEKVTLSPNEKWVEVAVKLLKPEDNYGSLDELLVEAHIMSLLNHPNLVQMYGLTLRPTLGLIMEYLPESDLQRLLERHAKCELLRDIPHADLPQVILVTAGTECLLLDRFEDHVKVDVGNSEVIVIPHEWVKVTFEPLSDDQISWKFRVKTSLDIARGLEYLHSLVPPVIHRDLRSPNIFLVSLDENAPVIAKVADFGLAAESGGKLGKHLLTWQWLAPEVLSMSRSGYDLRSDVYSFAIVLYEIATRKFPYLDDYSDRFRKGKSEVNQHCFVSAILSENLRPIVDGSASPAYCPSPVGWEKFCRLMAMCWVSSPGPRTVSLNFFSFFFLLYFSFELT
jgi:serine/threonine protein kinase